MIKTDELIYSKRFEHSKQEEYVDKKDEYTKKSLGITEKFLRMYNSTILKIFKNPKNFTPCTESENSVKLLTYAAINFSEVTQTDIDISRYGFEFVVTLYLKPMKFMSNTKYIFSELIRRCDYVYLQPYNASDYHSAIQLIIFAYDLNKDEIKNIFDNLKLNNN